MLVLSRKVGEKIVVANDITIEVVEIKGGKVRLGINAPKDVPVHRQEIADLLTTQGQQAQVPVGASKPI